MNDLLEKVLCIQPLFHQCRNKSCLLLSVGWWCAVVCSLRFWVTCVCWSCCSENSVGEQRSSGRPELSLHLKKVWSNIFVLSAYEVNMIEQLLRADEEWLICTIITVNVGLSNKPALESLLSLSKWAIMTWYWCGFQQPTFTCENSACLVCLPFYAF